MSEVKVYDENFWIGTAYAILRRLNDGREPYAASVKPMAEAVKALVEPHLNEARSAGRAEGVASERRDVCAWLRSVGGERAAIFAAELADGIESGEHVGGVA